jgi:VIT1/CCC1 family predicted Fe2+/Mn2+ transporter
MKTVATSIAGSAASPAGAESALSPVDRVSEVIFGLIMALTFTGSLSVATADRGEVRSMLIGALGCNIAWGLVDAVMFLLGMLAERGRNLALLREVRTTSDPARARHLITTSLPPVVASTMDQGQLESIRSRLTSLPEPPAHPALTARDFRTAVAVFLLVFLATLPVALPFTVIPEAHRALRLSNGIALVMLFLGGYYLGRHGGRNPWRSGLVMLAVGAGLVWATIALGG